MFRPSFALLSMAIVLSACTNTPTGVATTASPSAASAANSPAPSASPTPSLIGKAAPAISFVDQSGKTHSLAEFKGKPTLLVFWATWCPHCQAEMPKIQTFFQQASMQNVKLVPVEGSMDAASDVTTFASTYKVTVTLYHDPSGLAFSAFNGAGFPTLFMLGADGTVKGSAVGELDDNALQLLVSQAQ